MAFYVVALYGEIVKVRKNTTFSNLFRIPGVEYFFSACHFLMNGYFPFLLLNGIFRLICGRFLSNMCTQPHSFLSDTSEQVCGGSKILSIFACAI